MLLREDVDPQRATRMRPLEVEVLAKWLKTVHGVLNAFIVECIPNLARRHAACLRAVPSDGTVPSVGLHHYMYYLQWNMRTHAQQSFQTGLLVLERMMAQACE